VPLTVRANVALVPGVIGFDRLGPLHYFNGVAAHLEGAFPGLTVRELTTDPLGTVSDRAEVLANEIVRVFGASGLVHLVAHSMGGLDARFLVSNDVGGLKTRVATVVGISTPHRGSPVASVFDAGNPLNLLPGLGHPAGLFFDELRAHTNAVHDLSEAGAAALDARCQDDPHVRYLDVAATGRPHLVPTSTFFLAPYGFVKARKGDNDGVVPVSSSVRRQPPLATWAGDHADLIGHDLDSPLLSAPAFDYLRAYEDIVRRGIVAGR